MNLAPREVPRHVAIIMDGNGRWAQARGHTRFYGHVRGMKRVRETIRACDKRGIEFLTLYAFSSENWTRPKEEVSFLMKLLLKHVTQEAAQLIKENVRVRVIGDASKLPSEIVRRLDGLVNDSKSNSGLVVSFALNYGSRQELIRASRALYRSLHEENATEDCINEESLSRYLDTYGTPDPDLIIRTSGEQRLSNFLLWQAAYSEFYFTDIHWPDFTSHVLDQALLSFNKRTRRFGGVSQVAEEARPSW